MIDAQETVNHLVERSHLLQEMIAYEPEILLLLKTAALFTDRSNRWHMYEELKRRGKSLVGFGATVPELSTSRHYEAVLDAIDELLVDDTPVYEEGVTSDEETLLPYL